MIKTVLDVHLNQMWFEISKIKITLVNKRFLYLILPYYNLLFKVISKLNFTKS